MTTKRFTTKQEVLNQLNELYEQDLAMKKDIKCELLCLKEKYEELLEENKQLQHDATILIQSNQAYRKENKELKKELDQFYLLIGRGDWSKLVDLLTDNKKVNKIDEK